MNDTNSAMYEDWVKKCRKAKTEMIGTETGMAPMAPEPENVRLFKEICGEMTALYERKNKDYGDSFHISFQEEGMAMARIRLGDKLNRFKTLTKNGGQMVNDESIRDTLIDLSNYSIMTVMEIDRQKEE